MVTSLVELVIALACLAISGHLLIKFLDGLRDREP